MQRIQPDVDVQVVGRLAAGIEAVAVFLSPKESLPDAMSALLPEAERRSVTRLIAAGIFRGKEGEVASDLVEMSSGRIRRVLLVGLGKSERTQAEAVRRAGAAAARAVGRARLATAAICPPPDESGRFAAAAVSGFMLARFRFDEFKGAASRQHDDDNAPRRMDLSVLTPSPAKAKEAVERALVVAEAQNLARTVASRPGNEVDPVSLADFAMDMAQETGLTCRVMDEKELKKLGMGGLLAVGAASARPPRLIVLEYAPRKPAKGGPLLAVGKAITFDTGGISIKPAEKMGRMIYDKCGGMAVLGLMYATARLKGPVRVVGILAAAENTLGPTAFRPGDILRMYNGVTVEVTNTDAEGRLVLADALAWAVEKYAPAQAVDLATLTGGVITALGKTMAGYMTTSDEMADRIEHAAEKAGEKLWRLPLGPEQREQIKSDHADIVNSAGREAHPLQGGAFLSHFVPESVPWAHLDIAGVADTEKEHPLYARGATGWGVRTLVEWVLSDPRWT